MNKNLLCIFALLTVLYKSSISAQSCSEVNFEFNRPLHPDENQNGPFYPGELVTICMNVKFLNDIPADCQWLQGLIPTFGNAWNLAEVDLSEFGPTGSSWLDEGNVDYNLENEDIFINVNSDDKLYLNKNYEGTNLTSGTLLPSGWWFTSQSVGCAGSQDDPDNAWGLPISCGKMVELNFCINVPIKENPQDDIATVELFPFADGETGCWTNKECQGGFGSASAAVQSTTSLKFDRVNSEKVFPNPFHNELNFELKSDENSMVSIFDIHGKLIIHQNAKGVEKLNTISLLNGVYFVQITSDSGTNLYRLIKQN